MFTKPIVEIYLGQNIVCILCNLTINSLWSNLPLFRISVVSPLQILPVAIGAWSEWKKQEHNYPQLQLLCNIFFVKIRKEKKKTIHLTFNKQRQISGTHQVQTIQWLNCFFLKQKDYGNCVWQQYSRFFWKCNISPSLHTCVCHCCKSPGLSTGWKTRSALGQAVKYMYKQTKHDRVTP